MSKYQFALIQTYAIKWQFNRLKFVCFKSLQKNILTYVDKYVVTFTIFKLNLYKISQQLQICM